MHRSNYRILNITTTRLSHALFIQIHSWDVVPIESIYIFFSFYHYHIKRDKIISFRRDSKDYKQFNKQLKKFSFEKQFQRVSYFLRTKNCPMPRHCVSDSRNFPDKQLETTMFLATARSIWVTAGDHDGVHHAYLLTGSSREGDNLVSNIDNRSDQYVVVQLRRSILKIKLVGQVEVIEPSHNWRSLIQGPVYLVRNLLFSDPDSLFTTQIWGSTGFKMADGRTSR